MSDVVCRSEVRIERVKGPIRKAYRPTEKEAIAITTELVFEPLVEPGGP